MFGFRVKIEGSMCQNFNYKVLIHFWRKTLFGSSIKGL